MAQSDGHGVVEILGPDGRPYYQDEEDLDVEVDSPDAHSDSFLPSAFMGGKSDHRLLEQVLGLPNVDEGTEFDDNLFVRLDVAGVHDLPPEAQQRAQRLAFLLYRINVRAYGGVELGVDFVVGKGVKIKATDPKVDALLKRHWRVNRWGTMLREYLRALAIFGELLFPVFVSEKGFVRISSISPFRIGKLIRNPDDGARFDAIVVRLTEQYATGITQPLQGGDPRDEGKRFTLIQPDDDGFLIDEPDKKVGKDGLAFFFPANRVAGSSRGTPDYMASIDFLQGLDGFTMALLERADLALQIVYDVQYDGLQGKELKKKANRFATTLKKGGIWAHNDAAKLTIHQPNIGASEAEATARILKDHIHAGFRKPAHFFGDVSDLTRSAAQEISIVISKSLEGRQQFAKDMIEEVLTFQIEQAMKRGLLPKDVDTRFSVEFPPLFLRDLSGVATALVQLVSALDVAVLAGYITLDVAKSTFQLVLSQITNDVEGDGGPPTIPPEIARAPEVVEALAKVSPALAERLKEHFPCSPEDNGSDG